MWRGSIDMEITHYKRTDRRQQSILIRNRKRNSSRPLPYVEIKSPLPTNWPTV
jgi:hypothetical protein